MARQRIHPGIRASKHRTNDNIFDALDPAWKQSALQKPSRHEKVAARAAQTSALIAEMRTMTAASTRLQRMGAILLLCSLIEGRITAMYEDRMAVIHHTALPSIRSEVVDATVLVQGDIPLAKKPKSETLSRMIDILAKHGDITTAMANEYHEFRTYRNALIHDATHHGALFRADVVQALILLYEDLVRIRKRVRTRVRGVHTISESQ